MSKVIRLNDKCIMDIDIIRDFLYENLKIDKDTLSDSVIIDMALRNYLETRLNDLYFNIHKNDDDFLPFDSGSTSKE